MLSKTIKQLIILSLLLLVSLPVMAAEVIIDSNLNTNADIYSRKNMVVFVTDQVGYVFYSDNSRNVVYKKTNNGGASWGGKVTLFRDAASAGVMIWYDRWTPGDIGTKVHLISVDDGQDELHYAEFDVTNDTVTGNTFANLSVGKQRAFLETYNRYTITKATDGSLYAGIIDNDGSGSYVRKCASDCELTASWSDAGNLPFADQLDGDIVLMPLAGGDILGMNQRDGSGGWWWSKYTRATNSWSAQALIPGATNVQNDSYKSSWGATVNPNNFDIYLVRNYEPRQNGGRIDPFVFSSGTWTQKPDLEHGNSEIYSTSFAINPNDSKVYAVTVDRNHSADVVMRSSDVPLGPQSGYTNLSTTNDDRARSVSVNLVNNERIYAVWHAETVNQLRGNTAADPVATTPAPAICLEPDPYDGFSAAKTTIDLSSDGTYNTPKGPSMVFTSTDIGYMFFVDDSNTNIVYRKTLDGGKTWSQRVTVANMSNTTKQLVVYYDKWTPGLTSNKIHLFIGTNNSKTNYIEFSPGADASTSSRTIYTGVNYDSYSTISGMISGEGKLYVTMSNTGGRLLSCSNDCAGSGTWTQVANYPYNDRHNWHELRLAPLKNDKLLVLHWDTLIGQPTTEHIFYSIYDPTLSTLSTFSPSADLGLAYDNIVTWPGAWGTTYNKSTDETYLCYNDHVYGNGYGNLGDIKTAVFDDSGLLRTGVAVNNEEGFQCDLAYDELTGDTYLIRSKEFVGDFDNEKVFMTKSSDGMVTWSNSIQVNIEAASDSDGGSNYRQIGMNVSSPDRIYAWLWELLPGSTYYDSASASAKYYGVSVTENNGTDRLNPNQSQADWFHFVGF